MPFVNAILSQVRHVLQNMSNSGSQVKVRRKNIFQKFDYQSPQRIKESQMENKKPKHTKEKPKEIDVNKHGIPKFGIY